MNVIHIEHTNFEKNGMLKKTSAAALEEVEMQNAL